MKRAVRNAAFAITALLVGCLPAGGSVGSPAPGSGSGPATAPGTPASSPGTQPTQFPPTEAVTPPGTPRTRPATGEDTAGALPVGRGTLRQEDLAISLEQNGVRLRLMPLDESVIRLLAPDSYKALHDLVDSRRPQIDRLASMHNVRQPSVWFVSFFGTAPEARFTPMDITITASGREFRPLEVVPLTTGFGAQRVRSRETQSALYIFEDGLDLWHPLTVSMGSQRSSAWQDILRRLERERALIRSRVRR